MTKEPKLQVKFIIASLYSLAFFIVLVILISFLFSSTCKFSQGARRIVPEWVDLDFEARRFTAKILGEEIDEPQEPVTSLGESQNLITDNSSNEDKSEL